MARAVPVHVAGLAALGRSPPTLRVLRGLGRPLCHRAFAGEGAAGARGDGGAATALLSTACHCCEQRFWR